MASYIAVPLQVEKNIVLFYDNETSDQVLQLNHAFTI